MDHVRLATLLPATGTASLAALAAATDGVVQIVVVPATDWPRLRLSDSGIQQQLPAGAVLVTTQGRVDAAAVRHKLGLLDLGTRAGLHDYVGALSLAVAGPGRWWLFDGHHDLAARLLLGGPIEVYVHGPGPREIGIPRLRRA